MPNSETSRLLRPETLTAIGIFIAVSRLLIPAFGLPAMSALLPATMLVALMVLAALMLAADQHKAATGEAAKPMVSSPRRVLTAFALIAFYALSVDFIGFYISTAIAVPLVAYVFGFRNPLGLAIATVIVLAAIYLIFTLTMSQEFPAGRLWSR